MNIEEKIELFKNTIKETTKKLENIKKEQESFMNKEFPEMLKLFFQSCPNIKSIYWTQYTPYYNDGDICIFSINDVFYTVKSDTEKRTGILAKYEPDIDYEANDSFSQQEKSYFISYDCEKTQKNSLITIEEAKILIKIKNLLHSLEDFLLIKFGDPSEVFCYFDGSISVSEYYQN